VGRHLIPLACDNCVPGAVPEWFFPVAVLLALAGVGAAVLLCLRAGRVEAEGRRRAPLFVAALCLAFAPAGASFAMSLPVTWHDVTCGSALATSRERGLPDDTALDEAQAGCKARGLGIVHGALGAGAGLAGVGALVALASALPPRRVSYA
jgi:hypothetical protein